MKSTKTGVRIPSATYRWQFNRDFTFQNARALIEYLHDLGVTDIYSSPIFTAPPDSNHGYDVCDYNQFNPVLGSEQDWIELTREIREREMGLLLDFVPNHMGAIPEFNGWWRDVLEYGIDSPHAEFFDVNWNPPEPQLKNRVLLPVLEDHYGRVLAQGIFKLSFEHERFQINYRDHFFPLHPCSYRRALEMIARQAGEADRKKVAEFIDFLPVEDQPIDRAEFEKIKIKLANNEVQTVIAEGLARFNAHSTEQKIIDELHALLEKQLYELAFWRTGTRVANYRRFFDVDSLIAVNMDRPEVFQAAHQLILKCVRSGRVTGLRLDHVDGLADPQGYLAALQKYLATKCHFDLPPDGRAFYILVEKIVMQGEELPEDWPVFGTTGYEFGAMAMSVFIDPAQEKRMTEIYDAFVPCRAGFTECVNSCKHFVMTHGLSKEVAILSRLLTTCARQHRDTRDLSPADLAAAITETIACFAVYRTYLSEKMTGNPTDHRIVERAINEARSENSRVDSLAFDCLRNNLLRGPDERALPEQILFRRRFQQFTGPIMAKSYEDTALFIFNRLIALNEVGGNPACFGVEPSAFHKWNAERFRRQPNAMLTTSTHDTKISEDARARVAALSQIPSQWSDFLQHTSAANAPHKKNINGKSAPDENEEYLFYQLLLGTWPLDEFAAESRSNYIQRLQRHMLKAMREAKVNTRWDAQNVEWENAVADFVGSVINESGQEFRSHLFPLARLVAELGAINSLSLALLKFTAPGVPDIYQGNELWQFILTDPDNRRTVDFALRQNLLASLREETPGSLLKNWRTGVIKMFLTRTVLQFRRAHPLLFEKGEYVPLDFVGKHEKNCFGFARRLAGQLVLVFAPRLTFPLGFPPVGACWESTAADVQKLMVDRFTDLFTGQMINGNQLPLSKVFRELPFAVLTAMED